MTAATAQMPPPSLVPEKIAMGAFYDGARVRIEGTAPSESGVLIVIRGAEKDELFNRKGRVGPIWLNADRIHIKQAPSMFLSFSTADAGSLLDRAALDQYQLDEAAIMNRIRCLCRCKCSLTDHALQSGVRDAEPDPNYGKLLHDEYLRLKEHEGSYTVRPHAVSLTAAANSETRYAVEFEWPKSALPGDYQVEVYACHGHKVIARSAATLQLVEVGFPAYMANLASKYPWVYGAGAVLVAMLAGFLTDALTSRLRRRKRGSPAERGLPAPEETGAAPEMTTADTQEAETVHHN